MLAAAARLRRREEFTRTVRGGRRAGRGAVVAHCLLSPDAVSAAPRVGFVVSKAVGNAVVRNLVTRRLRHLARPWLQRLPSGAMVVIRALPSASTTPFARLGDDLDDAIEAALAKTRQPNSRDQVDRSAGARRPDSGRPDSGRQGARR